MATTEDSLLPPASLDVRSVLLNGSAEVLVAWYRYSLVGTRRSWLARLLEPRITPMRQARSSDDLDTLEQVCRQVAALRLPARPSAAVVALADALRQLREDLHAADHWEPAGGEISGRDGKPL